MMLEMALGGEMRQINLDRLSASQLLQLHAHVIDELRERGVVRSANNPVADLAEYIFCRAFDWTQAEKSTPYADATCAAGKLYQVKGRRLTQHNQSRQLSAMRDLPARGFHYLAGVLFNEDYSVARAALVPHKLVLANATFVPHTNSWKFILRDEVWTWPAVQDVTLDLQSVDL